MTNCVISTINGGGEGSRTPVQKHFHQNFSERSLCLFKFAFLATQRQATKKTILLFPYATRSSRKVFLHSRHQTSTPAGKCGLMRGCEIRQLMRNYYYFQRLYLTCTFLRSQCSLRLAYPASTSLSKPLHPQIIRLDMPAYFYFV